jgi:hypothetical protein
MLESANRYAVTSREFIRRAQQYLAVEDLHQASEKGWGAAAEMVKAVAEERGWPHDSHRLLYRIIGDLARESGDVEISRLFKVASDLHINYYENWWSSAEVGASLQDVQRLLDKLEPLIEERL